jgi:hypothetical protein
VYSTGKYGSSSVTLEAWIGFVPYPAFVAQKNVTVDGNAQIQGAYGGVHSNQNLTVSASADIAQTATAVGTGTFTTSGTIGGFHAGGQPDIYIPRFVTEPTATSSPHLKDYIVQAADVILLDPGFADGATRDLTGNSAATVQLRKLADSLAVPSSQYSAFASAIDENLTGTVDQTGRRRLNQSPTNPITFTRDNQPLNIRLELLGGNWNIPSNSTGERYVLCRRCDNYNLASPGAGPKNSGNVDVQRVAAFPLQTNTLHRVNYR